MRNKTLFAFAVFMLVAVALLAASRFFSPQPAGVIPPSSVTTPPKSAPLSDGTASEDIEQEQSLSAVMSHPNVKRYLEREARKEKLQQYFTDVSAHDNKAEVWELIGQIERDGGMLAYEGMALKLAWLERHSDSEAAFSEASEQVLAEYRARAERSVGTYDPYKDLPGFAEYKAREQDIVAEVSEMTQIPGGLSKQEYLRKRLLAARERAFASQGGN